MAPFIFKVIRYIDADPQHDLHQYINFDDGPPTHLYRCIHPLRRPTVEVYQRRRNRGPTWLGNRFLEDECQRLDQEFVIYGVIGRGTFGSIFAARTKQEVDGKIQHYAIKVQLYTGRGEDATIGYLNRRGEGKDWMTHKEAAILNCLRGNDRVSQLHSAYLHEGFAYIVMNQYGVDYEPEMDTLPQMDDMDEAEDFPGYNGVELINSINKRPRLQEPQVRKVVSHLLEALMFLNDRRMTHQDLSHRNYLVDEDLNIQLIDFDVELTYDPADYRYGGGAGYVPAIEHMITPELSAILLDEDPMAGFRGQLEYDTRDVRDEPLWRLGVMMFELLHGHSPWDSPDQRAPSLFDHHLRKEQFPRFQAHRDDRRERMINDPLQISDTIPMTQDCVDVLKALLANKLQDRPSIEELVAFPWFQGSYLDGGDEFVRPERF